MAKAKIVKSKRKPRYDRIACMFLLVVFALFVGVKTGLKSYNYQLSIQASEVNKKVKKMQTAVNNLETEINKLQSRDRVLSMVEKDGIKTNQDQIVIIKDEDTKDK